MNIKSLKIGNQDWIAQNLGARGSPLQDRIGKGVFPDGKERNIREGGYLYEFNRWPRIPGWRVPKVEDWNTLISFLGADAGKKLISGSFQAVCCGYTDPWLKGFQAFGRLAVFWIDEIKPKTKGVP